MKKMSNVDFFNKVEWEGGLFELALYGINPSEIKDAKLKKLWSEYKDKVQELLEIADRIEELHP